MAVNGGGGGRGRRSGIRIGEEDAEEEVEPVSRTAEAGSGATDAMLLSFGEVLAATAAAVEVGDALGRAAWGPNVGEEDGMGLLEE